VKPKDGELTFRAERQLDGQTLTVKYTLKADGDAIEGEAEVKVGEDTHAIDIEGKREPKDK
jgi:hypothetical protein